MTTESEVAGPPHPRAAVQVLKPYVPGRSVASVQRELGITDLAKMNQNENPLGPSPRALEAAARALTEAHVYPEGPSPALRTRLAEFWDLPAEWILVGNGSDEVFRLLAETYLNPGDSVVVPTPSFAGYAMVAELMGAQVHSVPLCGDSMDLLAMARAARESRARILFLCRPNNPTGGVFPEAALRALLPTMPADTLVVLDEAYREFDETTFETRTLALEFPQLIVTRTFSKLYGLAGLRLGYGIMRPEILAPLLRVRDPFSVNLPAVAAGVAALDDREHRDRSLALVHQGREWLYALFERLDIAYTPSQANFVLFQTNRSAVDLYEAMLRRGVLLRPCTSFGLPHSLRVTVGTEADNRRFAQALEQEMAGV